MNSTSLTTTGTAAFGVGDLAHVIEWALMGFPQDQVASVSVGLAAFVILAVHVGQKVLVARRAAAANPVPQAQ
jgi:hypothetical protein